MSLTRRLGPRPYLSLKLIERLGLYSTVFTDPTYKTSYSPEVERLQPAYKVLETILQPAQDEKSRIVGETVVQNADEKYVALLLAAHVPWIDAPMPEPPKKGKALLPIPVSVAREGIKATNKICDVIHAAVRNAEEIVKLKDRLVTRKRYPHRHIEGEDPAARDVLGMAIRSWGASWRSQVLWAILAETSVEPSKQES